MFDKKYEDRLVAWSKFRNTLEDSEDPLRRCRELYNNAPLVSIYTDPWDMATWPDPWQLIDENRYCEFNIVLGMCYSLQLTERFSQVNFEIHICIDEVHSDMHYLLIIDNKYVLGYDREAVMTLDLLPKTLKPQQTYRMQSLQ